MHSSAVQDFIEQWVCLPIRAEVALLCAPFTFPPIPSIALSLFKRALCDAGISSSVLYPMFPLIHLLDPQELRCLNAISSVQGAWEYLFAPLTDKPCDATPQQFVEALFPEKHDQEKASLVEALMRARKCAAQIVEATAQRIVRMGVRVLAASSIYAQQSASLAILRRVKALKPDVVTLLGGNNVSGEMGLAVLRRYPSVDYISFGEGDENIVDFCLIALNEPERDLPYGILGRAQQDPRAIPHRITRDMNKISRPDYGDFFEEVRRERTGFYGDSISMDASNGLLYGNTLFLEGSRGCWWGEKHACSFCGLNGLVNIYREKRPERLLEEIREAYDAHPDCLIQLSDNVLGQSMYRKLLPSLAADRRDYRLSAEVKTNLKEADVAALAAAGFRSIQPGIESLNDHLLALMGKGNTAVRHVALLKYCRTHYVKPFWHMLYGIPGETEADYRALIALVPLLVHLPPPTTANPILFQRFSRYWTDPNKYGLELSPDRSYRLCYGDDEDFIRRIAMYYDLTGGTFMATKERHQALYHELIDTVEWWKSLQRGSVSPDLMMTETGEGVSVLDTRPCRARLLTRLNGLSAKVIRRCGAPISMQALEMALDGAYPASEIAVCVEDLIDRKLVLRLSDRLLSLAIPANRS